MFQKVRETHPEVREGSRDPPGGLGRVWRPTRRSGKGLETNPEVREGLGTHLEVWEVLVDPPGGPGRVGRPTR